MLALNSKVDDDGEDPAIVARDWLIDQGLLDGAPDRRLLGGSGHRRASTSSTHSGTRVPAGPWRDSRKKRDALARHQVELEGAGPAQVAACTKPAAG